MNTSTSPYVMTQQPANVYYSPNNEAYSPDQNNESNGVQPYKTVATGQPYNPSQAQPYGPQVTVVTQARQPAPNSCLAYSIFTCICCCWPLGIMAIVFSCKSSDASNEGDMDKARSYSKKACIVSSVALACGIVIIIAVIVTQVVAARSTSTSSSYYYRNGYYYYR